MMASPAGIIEIRLDQQQLSGDDRTCDFVSLSVNLSPRFIDEFLWRTDNA
jgi:hypothetical protein